MIRKISRDDDEMRRERERERGRDARIPNPFSCGPVDAGFALIKWISTRLNQENGGLTFDVDENERKNRKPQDLTLPGDV